MRKRKSAWHVLILIWILMITEILVMGHALRSRAENIKTVGNVHISCISRENRNAEAKTEEIQYVKPGDRIEKQTEIRVKKGSHPSYLRVKVLLCGGTAAQQKDLLEQMKTGEQWYYCEKDGYFYYQKPVKEGDTALFPAALYVPEQWSGLKEEVSFRMNLRIEAAEAGYLELVSAGGSVFGWELR